MVGQGKGECIPQHAGRRPSCSSRWPKERGLIRDALSELRVDKMVDDARARRVGRL